MCSYILKDKMYSKACTIDREQVENMSCHQHLSEQQVSFLKTITSIGVFAPIDKLQKRIIIIKKTLHPITYNHKCISRISHADLTRERSPKLLRSIPHHLFHVRTCKIKVQIKCVIIFKRWGSVLPVPTHIAVWRRLLGRNHGLLWCRCGSWDSDALLV